MPVSARTTTAGTTAAGIGLGTGAPKGVTARGSAAASIRRRRA
jgi:hypothetical protein